MTFKVNENKSLNIKTATGEYKVNFCRGGIKQADKYIKNNKALIITDNGVPAEYAQAVKSRLSDGKILTLPQGEATKNMDNYQKILSTLVENNFTRSDCIVAVGGGVVGDLAGFAASTYMRGIDFYNIPTTVLSQVDSSVGGKTAIDFMGIKNIVGAFYPPKAVIIDTDTLKTLPERQIANGLAESVKMALTNDKELFELFENSNPLENLEEIIYRSVKIKAEIVEADEKEKGLRRVLNFGHTLAHAIESVNQMEKYYHGECVAIGMVPMCDTKIRERVINVLNKLILPTKPDKEDADEIIKACIHDKKMSGDDITVVYVSNVGEFRFEKIPFSKYEDMIRQVLNQ
ncbi:MAG: 3-dehydroquinate synthase [Ruminococcaceae bacterium]|nr:3-dehydroquinate synthase [Oscillospiraceae bacterium]